MRIALPALLAASLAASPAVAGEIFAGAYVHDVATPLSLGGVEPGIDLLLGYRAAPLVAGLQPYGFAALNSAGDTHYAAVGLAWKFGTRIYLRPGLGLAIHSGSAANSDRTARVDFGSRLLLAPELGIGVALGDRASIEASWVHMSHAQLFGRQNPGMDNLGLRLNWRL